MKKHVMSADIKLSKLIKDMQKFIKDMENMLQCHQQKSVSQDKYIPTSYCEVGRTYRIPCEDNPNCYRKAIVTKLMEDFAVVRVNGEEFSVPLSDLHILLSEVQDLYNRIYSTCD